jgi:hypothetical protein
MVLGSKKLSDAAFLGAFADGTLKPTQFRHADHLRLAWLLVHESGMVVAIDLVRDGIRAFAALHGFNGLYHETITQAWVRLIATHHEASFHIFLEQNEHRLNRELLYRFWSPEILDSNAARDHWIPPDRQPLPECQTTAPGC